MQMGIRQSQYRCSFPSLTKIFPTFSVRGPVSSEIFIPMPSP